MSNEVNIVETFRGTIDRRWSWQFHDWSGDYYVTRIKARFFTAEPDPDPPLGTGVRPQHLDPEITRVQETVWEDTDGRYAFQGNAEMANTGTMRAGHRILRADRQLNSRAMHGARRMAVGAAVGIGHLRQPPRQRRRRPDPRGIPATDVAASPRSRHGWAWTTCSHSTKTSRPEPDRADGPPDGGAEPADAAEPGRLPGAKTAGQRYPTAQRQHWQLTRHNPHPRRPR